MKKYLALAANELTALELNDKEIIDHILNVRINWDDVSDIQFKKQGNSGYFYVLLKDKKVAIRQTKNIFKKGIFYINTFFFGTPIRILPMYIKGTDSEIFDKINTYFHEIHTK